MAGREDAGRGYYDTAAGDNGPPAGGKRRLIREGWPASRVSGHVRPRDPGGGTVSTVSPRRMTYDDVFQAVEQSGGDLSWFPPGVSTVWTEETLAGDTHDVLMMMLKYDREWAQCGCRKIKCLL